MTSTGLSYMRVGDVGGDAIYAGSVFAVKGYPRGYTYYANKNIYSGTGHNDRRSYSYLDTGAFAYYQLPYTTYPFGPSTNVWYLFLRNQWIVYG